MSGDARVVWAVTGEGRLIRTNVESGETIEVIPRTPTVRGHSVARGSLNSLEGSGMLAMSAEASALPLPISLAGFSARLNGVSLPVLRGSPGAVEVQIPWEIPLGSYPFEFETDAGSFWEQAPTTLRVVEAIPRAVLAGPYPPVSALSFPFVLALSVHGDWSALISRNNPARSGEVIHLYATGLGPVDAPVRAGEPTPEEPLPRLSRPLPCGYYNTEGTTLPLPPALYAGLAPGLVGIYQVTFQIPSEIVADDLPIPGVFRLECEPPNAGSLTALVPMSSE
jgi:uncharacterized protein (TIGR03437 family)